MQLFEKLYHRMMAWADHRFATRILGGLSFAESSFFPVPPDVMLIPMCLKQPSRAWYLAGITTLASVFGGIAGYYIGYFLFDLVEPVIRDLGYWEKFVTIKADFEKWGIWIVFVAGFSPIPYKIFTVTAGMLSLSFIPFVAASFVGRGARFFLVAGLVKHFGPKFEPVLQKYIERIGWGLVVLLTVLILVYKI